MKTLENITPRICQKYNSCSAPVCPFDTSWPSIKHLPGEPVCKWLRESMKPGSEAILSHALTGELAGKVAEVRDALLCRKGALKYSLRRAEKQGRKVQLIKRKEIV